MANEEELIAAASLASKLKLESLFKPSLNSFFSQIGKDIAIVWAATQNIPSLHSFQTELVSILRSYYRKIAKEFNSKLSDRIIMPELTALIQNDNKIPHNIVTYINNHSVDQAHIILDTTRKDLQEIAAKEIMKVAVNGQLTTDYTLGKSIQKAFEQSAESRTEIIAITETQIAAESIKFIEAQGIDALANGLEDKPEITKTWSTILDNKTRHAHAAADMQVKPLNAPYIVKGQLLMFPGDVSLGATLDNIMGCRCDSVITVS